MPIILDTPIISEVLEYKYIFMTGLRIKQEPSSDASVNPKYSVNIRYKLYSIDSSNKRHFKKSNYSINIPNYFSDASAQSALGDNRMMDALSGIESALSKLISEKGDHGNTGIVK